MAFSLIAAVSSGTDGNGTTSSAINTTGADLIVVVQSDYGAGGPTGAPSDSKGNTWTALTRVTAGSAGARIYYCASPTVGAGHTFSQGGSNYPSIHVSAWSGAHATPFDQETGAGSTSVTSKAPGSLTPSEGNCLVVAGLAYYINTGSATIDGGFAIDGQLTASSGNYVGGGTAHLIQNSAAASNPAWSFSSQDAVAVQASFKSAGGGGGGGVFALQHIFQHVAGIGA